MMRWISHWEFDDWADLCWYGLMIAIVFGGVWAGTDLVLERIG